MGKHHVEGVTRGETSRNKQQRTRGALAQTVVGDGVLRPREEGKRLGLVEQREIDAAAVGRVGHHGFVAQSCQAGAVREVGNDAVVFYLAHPDHIDRLHTACRHNHPSQCPLFVPIA